jgi:hypothetical protein
LELIKRLNASRRGIVPDEWQSAASAGASGEPSSPMLVEELTWGVDRFRQVVPTRYSVLTRSVRLPYRNATGSGSGGKVVSKPFEYRPACVGFAWIPFPGNSDKDRTLRRSSLRVAVNGSPSPDQLMSIENPTGRVAALVTRRMPKTFEAPTRSFCGFVFLCVLRMQRRRLLVSL